jgi:uncharacterized membrane protein
MYSKVKIFGHPIHPMLVAYPVAFYTATLVCYIVYNSNQNPFWFKVAVVANIAGVIMAAVAAIPGFIDWLFIPARTAPKTTGLFHLACNVLALVCFGAVVLIEYKKWNDVQPTLGPAILLSAIGFLLTIVAGFLGFTLIQKHHVGVDIENPNQRI